MTDNDALGAELHAFGEPLRTETADDELIDRIVARAAATPVPRRRRSDVWRSRFAGWRRWAIAGVAGLVAVVVLVPPIRAAVVDWFGFGGVIVRESPGSAPSSAPEPPAVDGEGSLARAQRSVDFGVLTPRALGEPDAVEVTGEQRILSMAWETSGGRVRLDQFEGTLEPVFMKELYGDATPVSVGGEPALWLDQPHNVVVLDSDGTTYATKPRLAGSTLIWQHGDTTLRLEGGLDRARALEIARSARKG